MLDQSLFAGAGSRSKGSQSLKPKIRANLVVELDYKTVKKDVWTKFLKIYGGGPSIVREKPQIYSTPVEDGPVYAARLRSPSPLLRRVTSFEKANEVNKTLPKKNSKPDSSKSRLSKLTHAISVAVGP